MPALCAHLLGEFEANFDIWIAGPNSTTLPGLRANAFTANDNDSGHVLYAAWTLLLENVKPGPASWSNQLENWESLVRRGGPRKPRALYAARARTAETSGCRHS